MASETRTRRNYLEQEAAEIAVELPRDRHFPFLLDDVQPFFEGPDRRADIAYWTFCAFPPLAGGDPGLLILARPSKQIPLAALEARIRRGLAGRLRAKGGRWLPNVPEGFTDTELALARYGGARGLRIYSEFSRVSAGLALDTQRLFRDDRDAERASEVEIGTFFFLMDALRVRRAERPAGAAGWARFLAAALGRGPSLLKVSEELSAEALERKGPLTRLLKRYSRPGGWRTLPRPYLDILRRRERPLRRVGRMIDAHAPLFHRRFPRLLAIFHSYLHSHFHKMGVGGSRELLLTLLVHGATKKR